MELSKKVIEFAEACRDGDIIEGKPVQLEMLARNAQALIDEYEKRIAELEKRSLLLQALEEVGVDNWDGYGDAQCLLDEWEAENNAS